MKAGPRKLRQLADSQICESATQPHAAEMLNVSARAVSSAKKVQESGDAALIADVEAGKVTVSAAAQHVAAVTRYPELSIIPTNDVYCIIDT